MRVLLVMARRSEHRRKRPWDTHAPKTDSALPARNGGSLTAVETARRADNPICAVNADP